MIACLVAFIDDSQQLSSLESVTLVTMRYRDRNLWQMVTLGTNLDIPPFYIGARARARSTRQSSSTGLHLVDDALKPTRNCKSRKASQDQANTRQGQRDSAGSKANAQAQAVAPPEHLLDLPAVLNSLGLNELQPSLPSSMTDELAALVLDEDSGSDHASHHETDHDIDIDEQQADEAQEESRAVDVRMDAEASEAAALVWPWIAIQESRPGNFTDRRTGARVGVLHRLGDYQLKATCKVPGHGKCICWVSLPPARRASQDVDQLQLDLIGWFADGTVDNADEHMAKSVSLRLAKGMTLRKKR